MLDDFEIPGFVVTLFTIVGVVIVKQKLIYRIWEIYNGVRVHFWSRLWKKDLVKTYGQWAVVTGSTDGIGKCYAKELAQNGMNILLIARNLEKLERSAREIKSQYGVETDIVQADFAMGQSIYDNIAKHLKDKDIGILVNNVGMLVDPRKFEELTEADIWAYVNVNVASVMAMTRLVLAGMLKKKKGAIINLSSIASYVPLAYMQVYAATKSFVSSFTRSLELEYGSSGLTIQCIEPGAVVTNMTKFDESAHKPSFLIPAPDRYAACALATLGYAKRTTGYWTHSLLLYIMTCFPERILMKGAKRDMELKEKKKKKQH